MKKSKIEWCDSTWNPVTGCLHGCEYCYARRKATRFGGASHTTNNECGCECQWITEDDGRLHDLNVAIYDEDRGHKAPYPFEFAPTFYRYRLGIPAQWTKPRNIFVCSMGELFGDWVPDAWITAVFDACKAAPQHRYLFLTKNPKRYCELADADKLPELRNFWYGSTITQKGDCLFAGSVQWNTFVSIEPLLEPIDAGLCAFGGAKWIIIGAETGNRKDKVVPKPEWVGKIVETARLTRAAVFMKDSLIPIVGKNNMLMEFPWKLEKGAEKCKIK